MALLALNFNGFVEKNNLLSYRELFASESTLLKGKALCEDLIEMDQQEYESVQLENAELNAVDQTDSSGTVVMGLLALTVIGFVGLAISLSKTENDPRLGLISGFIGGGSLCGAYSVALDSDRLQQSRDKISKIYDNRLLRLQDKVRCLESRIVLINEPLEREQLIQAKNHFSLKYERYLAEKINVINVKKVW